MMPRTSLPTIVVLASCLVASSTNAHADDENFELGDIVFPSSNTFCRTPLTLCGSRADEDWLPGIRVMPELPLSWLFWAEEELDAGSVRKSYSLEPTFGVKIGIWKGIWAIDLRYHGSYSVAVKPDTRWLLKANTSSVTVDTSVSGGFSFSSILHVGLSYIHIDGGAFDGRHQGTNDVSVYIGFQPLNLLTQDVKEVLQ